MRKLNDFLKENKGISLLELIIAMAIMAALVGVLVPQYIKFVNRGKKTADMENAEVIAKAFQRVMLSDSGFYNLYEAPESNEAKRGKPGKPKDSLSIRVDPQAEGESSYIVYAMLSSENFGMFSGTTYNRGNSPKNKDGLNIYEALNEELGIQQVDTATAQRWQSAGVGNFKNNIMEPQYKIKKQTPHPYASDGKVHSDVDRWRVCKNAETGQLEIWAADGSKAGGWPCFRVWPVPNDVYVK